MTEKIRIELDDATDAGAKSVEGGLQGIDKAAARTEQQLNQTADAAQRIGDADVTITPTVDTAAMSDLQTAANGVKSVLNQTADAASNVGAAMEHAAKSAEKIGDADDSIIDVVSSLKDVKSALEGVDDKSGEVAKAIQKIGDADDELSKLRQQFKDVQAEINELRSRLQSTETHLDGVGQAARNTASAVSEMDRAFDTDAHAKVSRLEGTVSELKTELGGASKEADGLQQELEDVGDAGATAGKKLDQAGDAAKGFGEAGRTAGEKSGMAITEFNQGLELAKKGAELLTRGVTALAADGSPAFQRLQSSVGDLQGALLDLANDPTIQDWIDQLAEKIKTDLIPTVNSIPDYWRGTQKAATDALTASLEAIGVFTAGASDTLKQMQSEAEKRLDDQKKAVELERQQEAGQGRILKIQEQVAEQDRLMNMAKIQDLNTVNELLYDEQERLKVLVTQGRATKEEQEESARRIMLLEKRRLEIPREQAEAAKRAAEEAARAAEQLEQDRKKSAQEAERAEEDYQRKVESAQTAANKVRESETKAMIDALDKKKQELVSLIQNAQGDDGKNMLDTARQQLDPRKVREEYVRKKQEEARANWTSPDDNAAAAGARRNAAAKQAGIQAFRDFNAGRADQADVAGAQNSLIQTAAKQAQGRGQLDQQTADALIQATQNQQNIVATQERQAQQLRQIQQALAGVGNASRNMNAQARRVGL